jgi:hypothetical protein
MSVTKQLARSEWEQYFDWFTKRYLRDDRPETATIELLSPELGDQTSAAGVALLGIAFEPKEGTLEVLLDGVDHLVFHPAEIWVVEEKEGFLTSVEIVRADGDKEILTIRHAGLPARA